MLVSIDVKTFFHIIELFMTLSDEYWKKRNQFKNKYFLVLDFKILYILIKNFKMLNFVSLNL